MNDKIRIVTEIGILLIALAFIATPVAAVTYHINPVTKHTYQNFLPADMSSVSKNPLFHYTPVTDITTNFKTPSLTGFEDNLANPFASQQTYGCNCGSSYQIFGTSLATGFGFG